MITLIRHIRFFILLHFASVDLPLPLLLLLLILFSSYSSYSLLDGPLLEPDESLLLAFILPTAGLPVLIKEAGLRPSARGTVPPSQSCSFYFLSSAGVLLLHSSSLLCFWLSQIFLLYCMLGLLSHYPHFWLISTFFLSFHFSVALQNSFQDFLELDLLIHISKCAALQISITSHSFSLSIRAILSL